MIAFLLLLPAATWLWGAVLNLLDLPEPSAAITRVALAGLPFLVAALLLGRAAIVPALAALLTALALHAAWSTLVPAAMRRGWLLTGDDD